MANDLSLRILFDLQDKASAAMDKIRAAGTGLAKTLQQDKNELAAIKRTLDQGSQWQKLQDDIAKTNQKLAEEQQALAKLRNQIGKTGQATTRQAAQEVRLQESIARTQEKLGSQTQRLTALDERLKKAHFDTKAFGDSQAAAAAKSEKLTASVARQEKSLTRLAETQKRYDRSKNTLHGASSAATRGAFVTAGGAYLLHHELEDAKEYQADMLRIRALGMGSHAAEEADKWAKANRIAGVSMKENLEIYRDGLTIFADAHHAEMAAPIMQKISYANRAMYGEEQGADKSRQMYDMLKVIELRGATHNAAEFKAEADKIQRVMTSTGGRVGAEDYRQLIARGGVAAKRLKADVFYNVLEPLVQEMGGDTTGNALMSAYQNLYNGKTTTAAARRMQELGLVNPDAVEYDKTGQLKRMKVGSLKNAEQYVQNPFE